MSYGNKANLNENEGTKNPQSVTPEMELIISRLKEVVSHYGNLNSELRNKINNIKEFPTVSEATCDGPKKREPSCILDVINDSINDLYRQADELAICVNHLRTIV